MCHDNEEWCKIWRGIDLSFQNWHEKFDKFWPEHSKVCILMGSFWTKYVMFELKKYRGVMSHDTEDRYKIEGKLSSGLGNDEEFSKVLPEHLKVSKLRLWWDPFIHSRNNVWA